MTKQDATKAAIMIRTGATHLTNAGQLGPARVFDHSRSMAFSIACTILSESLEVVEPPARLVLRLFALIQLAWTPPSLSFNLSISVVDPDDCRFFLVATDVWRFEVSDPDELTGPALIGTVQ